MSAEAPRRRGLAIIICLMVAGLLIAGLWPFGSPKNNVSWLADGQGIRFGSPGIVLGSRPFGPLMSESTDSCSLEIWMQPAKHRDSSTILAFYQPNESPQFVIRQSLEDLVCEMRRWGDRQRVAPEHLYVPGLLGSGRQVFVTISSDQRLTSVYVDGVLVRTSRNFSLSAADFAGQLVLGTSPVSCDNWSGKLRGLALYRRGLTAPEIRQHYELWQRSGRPDAPELARPEVLYVFNERSGNKVQDVYGGFELQIPERFLLVDHVRLEPPTLENVGDILVNVVGFIPFGICLFTYFHSFKGAPWPLARTVLLGAALSFFIEFMQAYIPTRDSDLTDVITNTLGTAIGALASHWPPIRSATEKLISQRPRIHVRSSPR
jgi:VanZ family protein